MYKGPERGRCRLSFRKAVGREARRREERAEAGLQAGPDLGGFAQGAKKDGKPGRFSGWRDTVRSTLKSPLLLYVQNVLSRGCHHELPSGEGTWYLGDRMQGGLGTFRI